jgi:hypothetical protein
LILTLLQGSWLTDDHRLPVHQIEQQAVTLLAFTSTTMFSALRCTQVGAFSSIAILVFGVRKPALVAPSTQVLPTFLGDTPRICILLSPLPRFVNMMAQKLPTFSSPRLMALPLLATVERNSSVLHGVYPGLCRFGLKGQNDLLCEGSSELYP